MTAGYVVTPLEGIARRAALAGVQVHSSPSDNISHALAAARAADVTIIVGGASSGEAQDRSSLNLDGDQDQLIFEVAAVCPKTVVLLMTCGAVLTPWRTEVHSVVPFGCLDL